MRQSLFQPNALSLCAVKHSLGMDKQISRRIYQHLPPANISGGEDLFINPPTSEMGYERISRH